MPRARNATTGGENIARTSSIPRQPEALLDGSVISRRTSLSLPPGMPLERWRDVGRHIFTINDSSGWWLGDWLIYGQSYYPDRYRLAIAETALSYQTLRNYAWIASRFSLSRRRPGLSFQHHAEVASLKHDEQESWLSQAEHFGWSRNELRRRVRSCSRPELPPGRTSVSISVSAERRTRWEKAAASQSLKLSEWIVSVLDETAGCAA
ncbi:LmbU family transcriptional regulator [Streptomyces sp. 6N223]|uniref:LmbU family transcriptional regulator n=1 Tax=Streptomyces sp. 6N223 TaxID=3457412 RepID=UPI003FD37426